MEQSIGVHELEDRLEAILDQVAKGGYVTITREAPNYSA